MYPRAHWYPTSTSMCTHCCFCRHRAACCVLRAACYVLRATCYVLRATCYVLRVTCYVLVDPQTSTRPAATCVTTFSPPLPEIYLNTYPTVVAVPLGCLSMPAAKGTDNNTRLIRLNVCYASIKSVYPHTRK